MFTVPVQTAANRRGAKITTSCLFTKQKVASLGSGSETGEFYLSQRGWCERTNSQQEDWEVTRDSSWTCGDGCPASVSSSQMVWGHTSPWACPVHSFAPGATRKKLLGMLVQPREKSLPFHQHPPVKIIRYQSPGWVRTKELNWTSLPEQFPQLGLGTYLPFRSQRFSPWRVVN